MADAANRREAVHSFKLCIGVVNGNIARLLRAPFAVLSITLHPSVVCLTVCLPEIRFLKNPLDIFLALGERVALLVARKGGASPPELRLLSLRSSELTDLPVMTGP